MGSEMCIRDRYKEVFLPTDTPPISLNKASYIMIEFRSPINIIDPFKRTKFRRFLPIAGYLFSYNIGELARLTRDNKLYWDLINYVSAALQETHNVWDTVRKIYYIYDGKEIPGLMGYVKYFVIHEVFDDFPSLKLLVENVLTHAVIMGVGAGRANGFGHVSVKVGAD